MTRPAFCRALRASVVADSSSGDLAPWRDPTTSVTTHPGLGPLRVTGEPSGRLG